MVTVDHALAHARAYVEYSDAKQYSHAHRSLSRGHGVLLADRVREGLHREDRPMTDTKRKADIDCDRRLKERGGTEYEGGWYFYECKDGQRTMVSTARFSTYSSAKQALVDAGYEFDNAGWRYRLLMWNWNNHSMDGFPGWEIENPDASQHERHPAFAKLAHRRGTGEDTVESHDLAVAWDDIAEVDFYQRDWAGDGIPLVNEGETYWSGWWFATIAERDRFVKWAAEKGVTT